MNPPAVDRPAVQHAFWGVKGFSLSRTRASICDVTRLRASGRTCPTRRWSMPIDDAVDASPGTVACCATTYMHNDLDVTRLHGRTQLSPVWYDPRRTGLCERHHLGVSDPRGPGLALRRTCTDPAAAAPTRRNPLLERRVAARPVPKAGSATPLLGRRGSACAPAPPIEFLGSVPDRYDWIIGRTRP